MQSTKTYTCFKCMFDRHHHSVHPPLQRLCRSTRLRRSHGLTDVQRVSRHVCTVEWARFAGTGKSNFNSTTVHVVAGFTDIQSTRRGPRSSRQSQNNTGLSICLPPSLCPCALCKLYTDYTCMRSASRLSIL